jgi:hypothetical protein
MSVLDVLDATNICTRWSDPAAWAMDPLPTPRREPVATVVVDYSWWSLARNPQALLLSGVITAGLVRDALARFVAP